MAIGGINGFPKPIKRSYHEVHRVASNSDHMTRKCEGGIEKVTATRANFVKGGKAVAEGEHEEIVREGVVMIGKVGYGKRKGIPFVVGPR